MKHRLGFLPPFRPAPNPRNFLSSGIFRLTVVDTRMVAFAVALLLVSIGCAREAPARGQKIAFFPSPASLSSDGKSWLLTGQGRIFEPADGGTGRRQLL